MLAFKHNVRDSDENSKPQKFYSFFPYDRLEISLILQVETNASRLNMNKDKLSLTAFMNMFGTIQFPYSVQLPY